MSETKTAVSFSEWSKEMKEKRAEKSKALDDLFTHAVKNSKEKAQADVDAAVRKAQDEAGEQVRRDYERRGVIDTPETTKRKESLRTMAAIINKGIEANQKRYNERYSFLDHK